MKLVLPLLLLSLAVAGCPAHSRVPGPTVVPPQENDKELEALRALLPEELRDTHLGMPLETFKQVKDTSSMEPYDGFDFRKQWAETRHRGPVQEVVYYFDLGEPGQPLYEYIIQYREGENVQARAVELFGPPNTEKGEWVMPDIAAFPIRAWTFDQKIVVVGVIPGTEYDPRDE